MDTLNVINNNEQLKRLSRAGAGFSTMVNRVVVEQLIEE